MNAAARAPATPATPAALRSFEAQWRARPADALADVRDQAMERVLRLGLPSMRDESWRYTNLRHIAAQSFADAPSLLDQLEPTASLSLVADTERAATVLMINGHPFLPKSMDVTFNGIEINSLKAAIRDDPRLIARYLAPMSDADQQRWSLLNTALFVDGLFLKVKGRVSTPLVILHVATAGTANTVSHPRVIIESAPGSSATIIEHHVGQGEHSPLCNSATSINLARDARLEHYRVFATSAGANHIDTLEVGQAEHSEFRQFTIALGGGLVRTALTANLNAAGALLDCYSLLVGHEARHVDCVNLANHNAPDTRSRQTARAIASGTSRVIFNSKVIVNAGSVNADSQQSFRGLLLSPTAEIDSRPQLEIYADEVKCAHGATTGRLDPDMLFYMLSRGLDRDTAQSLLVYAFLADVLTGMSVASARSAIEAALIAQLPDSQLLQKFR